VNNEIVIGDRYTSLLKTVTNMNKVDDDCEYERDIKVLHEPVVRNRTVRTYDFFNKLSNQLTNNNEILPVGCKFFRRIGSSNKLLVIEETPKIRTIKVDMGIESVVEKLKKTGKLKEYGYENYLLENPKSPRSFQLSFPYVVFIIMLNSRNEMCFMKPFFRLHPMTSLADYLFKAPLYNIPNGQDICLGGVQNFDSIYETVENIIETFWLNVYNYDYTNNIKAYEQSEAFEVQDYLTWMYHTKLNPMFIYGVDWIEYEMNIGQVVNNAEMNYSGGNSNSRTSYETIHNAMFQTNSIEVNPDSFAQNITLSIRMEGETLEIGDELQFDYKTYYLYSIVTKDNGSSYDSVELEDEEGVIICVPFEDFEDGFKTIFKPNFLEEVEVKGKVIKPGSIITCDIGGHTIYKKVKKIRKALDGKIEALIDTDHYLIENIDFDLIDISKVKIEGQLLDEDKIYNMINRNDSYCPSYYLRELSFYEISINTSGTFIIKFRDSDRERVTLNLNDYETGASSKQFINPDEIHEEEVFNLFDKILINFNNVIKLKIIKKKGILLNRKVRMSGYFPNSHDKKLILEKILIDDGKRLSIPGALVDIDFKVGDPIVYADWDEPDNMLYISVIDKFEVEENKLFVCSTTLNKKINFRIPIVNLIKFSINIGVIRKVESSCGEWKSGDKIKANSPGVTNFPKKDVNTIIAFINDGATKYPLALCSNLCTLWMKDDITSKFDIIPYNTARWRKVESVPYDVSKLKWQHGDNTVREGIIDPTINFLARRNGTQYGFEYHYITNRASIEWGSSITKTSLDNNYLRHGFLMPRISVSSLNLINRKGYPNMLGGFTKDSEARIYLRSEQLKEDF
jgi:hypothetical protein